MSDAPNNADARTDPSVVGLLAAPDGSAVLFPSCDPRGVLGRALAPDAPPWQTRPDALLFGWMLGLAPGVAAAGAARAVLSVASTRSGEPTEHQGRLLDGLRDIADGAPDVDPRRG